MILRPATSPRIGVTLWVLLALPPSRQLLEASMTVQMLVQLPLLAMTGWMVAHAVPRTIEFRLARWNHGGVAGLLLASFTGMIWMLPRMMDASIDNPWFAIAKFVSIPLLVGVPLRLSWPRAGFVVRGVFLLELIATSFRLGWLYLISVVRLCSNYLLGDQQLLGKYLLAIGVAISLLLAWKLVWGRVKVEPATR